MGAVSEILSDLVHKLGALAITFGLNVQTLLCFPEILVLIGLSVEKVVCTVIDHCCPAKRARGRLQAASVLLRVGTMPDRAEGLQMIKIWPKRRLSNDKSDVFWMGFGVVCCGGRKRARPAARGSAAGERAAAMVLKGLHAPSPQFF